MTALLPSVITVRDLALAELSAARLDGELFPLDEAFVAADGPMGPAQRGAALLAMTGPRIIAETLSALWIYGVLERPPLVHTVCVERADRARVPTSKRLAARETRMLDGDTERVGGMRLTVPDRVAFDLVRAPRFGPHEAELLGRLFATGSITRRSSIERLALAPSSPGSRIGRARLARYSEQSGGAQPALTRYTS